MSQFIELVCPTCREWLEVASTLRASAVRCPACRSVVRVRSCGSADDRKPGAGRIRSGDDYDLEPAASGPSVDSRADAGNRRPQREPRLRHRDPMPWVLMGLGLVLTVVALLIVAHWHNTRSDKWPPDFSSGPKLKPPQFKAPVPDQKPKKPPGKMPQHDLIREAELASELQKRLAAQQAKSNNILAVLKNWPPSHLAEDGDPLVVPFKADHFQISPDGLLLAVRKYDWQQKSVDFTIVDLTSGKFLSRFSYTPGVSWEAVFSPDSTHFAYGNASGKITIRDLNKDITVRSFPAGGKITNLAYAPDGKHLAVCVEGDLLLFDIESGNISARFEGIQPSRPVFSPDGELLAAAVGLQGESVALYEVASGGKIVEHAASDAVRGLIFTPDSRKLVVHTVGLNSGLDVWTLEADHTWHVPNSSFMESFSLSPDGKYLVCATDWRTLVILDMKTGLRVQQVKSGWLGGNEFFLAGGTLFASADYGSFRVWTLNDLLDPPYEKPVVVPPNLSGEDRAEFAFKWLGGTVIRDEKAPGRPIIHLGLTGTKLSDTRLKEIVGLQHLKSLVLKDTYISDVGLKHLSGLQNLETLDLSYDDLSDAGLSGLANLARLKSLILDGTRLDGHGLKHLVGLAKLQSLSMLNILATDQGLKPLGGLAKLQSLSLSSPKMTDAGIMNLLPLQKLKRLDLPLFQLTDAGAKQLGELKEVRELNLSAHKLTDECIKQLATLSHLRKLALPGAQVDAAGLAELAEAKELEELNLSAVKLSEAGFISLGKLTNLQALKLSWAPVNDLALKEVAKLKNLETLDLTGAKLAGINLQDLFELTSLRTLNLGSTGVSDAALKGMSALEKLESLSLRATKVSDAGLKFLPQVKSLHTLDLAGTLVTNEGLKELGAFIDLETLELGGTGVGDAGLKHLVDLNNLKKLNLAGTQVTDKGLQGLRKLKNLNALNLSQTAVTNAGLKELAELKNLQTLNLNCPKVSDGGLIQLIGLVNLKELTLFGSEVSGSGVSGLKKRLLGCRVLH